MLESVCVLCVPLMLLILSVIYPKMRQIPMSFWEWDSTQQNLICKMLYKAQIAIDELSRGYGRIIIEEKIFFLNEIRKKFFEIRKNLQILKPIQFGLKQTNLKLFGNIKCKYRVGITDYNIYVYSRYSSTIFIGESTP